MESLNSFCTLTKSENLIRLFEEKDFPHPSLGSQSLSIIAQTAFWNETRNLNCLSNDFVSEPIRKTLAAFTQPLPKPVSCE